MTAAAEYKAPSILGTSAVHLDRAPGLRAPARSTRRTPLALVTSVPRRRRAPFVVFCFLTLVAALATVLVLNISVSSGQYRLVQLHAQEAQLQKSNQELTQQVQNNQAPQNLVNKAAELGMVPSTSEGQINLKTGAVSGTPLPAQAGKATKSLIAATTVGGAAAVTPQAVLPGGPAKADPAAAPQADPAPAAEDLHGGTIPAPQQKNG